jgi:SAM-dependent methyltransferase
VLEVGAGIGGNLPPLAVAAAGRTRRWVALEPDAELAATAAARLAAGEMPAGVDVRVGTLATLGQDQRFDTILYLDVLEHIERDADELVAAARHLLPGGHLVVLVPAHAWLYSPFDAAIGHHRRYGRRSLQAVAPAGLERVELRYLDSVGMAGSMLNRFVLKQDYPTARQVAVWDRWMIAASRIADPLLGFRLGKSLLGVWRA